MKRMLDEVQAAVAARPADRCFHFLLDFDGTLAEFSSDPDEPELTLRRRDCPERISRQPDVMVGIVSGRRLDDLRVRTSLPDHVYLAGLHGLEIEIEGRRTGHPDLSPRRSDWKGWPSALEPAARPISRARCIEDKGASVAVHARAVAPDQRGPCSPGPTFSRCRGLQSAWSADSKVMPWSSTLPNIAGHKGEATQWITADVEAMHAAGVGRLHRRRHHGRRRVSRDHRRHRVLVGLRPTSATHKLDGIPDVDRFLRWLVTQRGKVSHEACRMTISAELGRWSSEIRLRGTRLIVVANREPYIHVAQAQPATGCGTGCAAAKRTDGVEWTRPASGLVTALDPVMRACGGTWIAHGSGSADRETVGSRAAASACRRTSRRTRCAASG